VGLQAGIAPVPEADTWAMLLVGLGLVGFAVRRRRVH
jgi:5'-nucleotidase / UDP-sugar diphosphatase